MQSYIKNKLKFILPMLFVLVTVGITNAQEPARIQFEKLNKLEEKAQDVVEVNIDGKLLDLAKRVLVKLNDKDAKTVGEAIKGLRGIYVRMYNFDKENQFDTNDIDEIRAQLKSPGWEKIANVRSKKDNQKIDIFTMFTGDVMSGVAVVLSGAKSVGVVNVIGPIDIDTLVEISGKLNIPKIDVETSSEKNDSPNTKKGKKPDNEN
ncbi:MAG: DUF4252 domain-containing protein [Pyrinomonadaceae bacterium]|nr:DUF4252 domain-containing protein [Pyrinomonadaceae bacterium]